MERRTDDDAHVLAMCFNYKSAYNVLARPSLSMTCYFSFVTASFFFVFRLYQTRASSSSLRAWAKRAFDFVCWLFSLRGGATFPK